MNKKSQVKGVETVVVLVFVVIIIVIVGSIAYKSSYQKKVSQISQYEYDQVAKQARFILRLPEFRCTSISDVCVDANKLRAVSELTEFSNGVQGNRYDAEW